MRIPRRVALLLRVSQSTGTAGSISVSVRGVVRRFEVVATFFPSRVVKIVLVGNLFESLLLSSNFLLELEVVLLLDLDFLREDEGREERQDDPGGVSREEMRISDEIIRRGIDPAIVRPSSTRTLRGGGGGWQGSSLACSSPYQSTLHARTHLGQLLFLTRRFVRFMNGRIRSLSELVFLRQRLIMRMDNLLVIFRSGVLLLLGSLEIVKSIFDG